MIRYTLVVLLLFLFPSNAFSDVIYFKDGRVVKVEKTWVEGGALKCNMYGGTVSFPTSKIARVEKRQSATKPKVGQTVSNMEPVKYSEARNIATKAYRHTSFNVFKPETRQETLEMLNQAREIDPNEAEILLVEAVMILQDGFKIGAWYKSSSFIPGVIDSAIEKTNAAIATDPTYGKSYSVGAWLHIIKSEYDKADELLGKAHQLNSKSFYLWLYKGTLSMVIGNYDEATEYFNNADHLAITDDLANLVRGRKKDLAKIAGDDDATESYYIDQINRYPSKPHPYGNYGSFLLCNGRFKEAARYYQKAINISPYPAAVKGLALATFGQEAVVTCKENRLQL